MIVFASDLHLSSSTPGISRVFTNFLARTAREASALYLLGDVFEYWPGDDDLDSPGNAEIVAALRAATDTGLEIGFLPGNRDFLVGEAFALAAGVQLLPDPFVLSLPSWQFVLTHGDQLCTDDVDYQAFRATVRSPAWREAFLAQPLTERRRQIDELRRRSEAAKSEKSLRGAYLMDVNAGTTDDFLRQHGYATLIHGHTHRPATHDHIVDGIHCERWVLSDWHETTEGAQGEVIAWDGEALHRLPVPG